MFWLDNKKTCISYTKGAFDKYCVIINGRGFQMYAPTDKEYFQWIKALAHTYGVTQVYNDFCEIYDIVEQDLYRDKAMSLIIDIDTHYNEDTVLWWIVFYMTMVAEENKEKAILGKRIKKLGVYNILIDEYKIDDVVQYMKGMRWQQLNELMMERGI